VAVVLAAGEARRFGGGKLAVSLEGRPLLQHVLDGLVEAGIPDPLVVVPPRTDLDGAISWGAARRVVNPDPTRGLASSLVAGWTAALAAHPDADAVLVALGDQPRVPAAVVRRLLEAPLEPARPFVAPRWSDGGRNPVRIELAAAPLVEAAVGDRGLGPILTAHPELVRWLEVDGLNPDVDTRSDLERLEAH
jgi:molybdenum cofactor cytidylyltransferase